MDIGLKMLGILEQVELLDEKTKRKIYDENHLTDGDVHELKLEVIKWHEYPSEFECQFCDETNEIHN